MAITREDLIAEARARGLTIPGQSDPNAVRGALPGLPGSGVTREQAYEEAKARGLIQQPEEMQMSATEPTLGNRIGQLHERASRAIGRGGEPIIPISSGVLGPFARKEAGKIAQGVKDEGMLFVGESIGEMAGSKFGPKGRIIGAGMGRAAGDAFKQIGEQIIASPNAPKSSQEAALRMLKEGGIAAGSEAVSEVAIKSMRRLATTLGFKSTVLKPLPDFDDVTRLAKKAGIDLTPAQRTSSRAVDTFEEIAENAFFGRGPLRDIKQVTQPAGIRRATNQLLDSFMAKGGRRGRGELGEMLNDTIGQKNKAFSQAGSALYKRVDKLNKNAVVDLKPLKKFALSIQRQRTKEGGLKQPIDDVIQDLLTRPDITDFGTSHRIRSNFLEIGRNAPSRKDRVVGLTKQASKLVDNQMEKASGTLSPEALKMWRAANGFWKEGKETFNSTVVKRVTKSILNDTPEKVLDVVFQAKSPKQIRTVMNLADPVTKEGLRFAFLDNMLEKSTRQIPGDISDMRTLIGKNFIEKFDSFGDDALDAIFSKEEKNRIRTLARLAKTTQGKTGGAGGFLVQLIQAAPLGATATGVVAGQPDLAKKGLITGIPIAGFTAGLSRLLRSKRGSKILTDSINVPKGTESAAAMTTRITREFARFKIEQRQTAISEQRKRRQEDFRKKLEDKTR